MRRSSAVESREGVWTCLKRGHDVWCVSTLKLLWPQEDWEQKPAAGFYWRKYPQSSVQCRSEKHIVSWCSTFSRALVKKSVDCVLHWSNLSDILLNQSVMLSFLHFRSNIFCISDLIKWASVEKIWTSNILLAMLWTASIWKNCYISTGFTGPRSKWTAAILKQLLSKIKFKKPAFNANTTDF